MADKAWKGPKVADGRRGLGIGFAQYKNLSVYVAAIAEVEVDRASGSVTVERVTAVCDAGLKASATSPSERRAALSGPPSIAYPLSAFNSPAGIASIQ